MKALYNNRLCNIVEVSSDDVKLAEEGRQFVVSLGDEALVIYMSRQGGCRCRQSP